MEQPDRMTQQITLKKPELILYGLNTRKASIFLVDSSPFVLGKDPACQGVISFSDEVSKTHAMISLTAEGNYVLRDLGSSNGTTLNGSTLSPGQDYLLSAGDRIGLSVCLFCVETVSDEIAVR